MTEARKNGGGDEGEKRDTISFSFGDNWGSLDQGPPSAKEGVLKSSDFQAHVQISFHEDLCC